MSLHHAPPVAYPVGRSYFLAGLLAAIWLLGALLVWSWLGLTRPSSAVQATGWGAVLLSGMAAALGWKQAAQGCLVWDGAEWHWTSAYYQTGVASYQLSVILDFQSCLLLRLENQAGASLWLWVEAWVVPLHWLDLRRAVYSLGKT